MHFPSGEKLRMALSIIPSFRVAQTFHLSRVVCLRHHSYSQEEQVEEARILPWGRLVVLGLCGQSLSRGDP